jgi:hypothetical protein
MSRELISSEKFPPKPHNCKFIHRRRPKGLALRFSLHKPILKFANTGPAVKVPGLVFCAGQTATGEIKQATVSASLLGQE